MQITILISCIIFVYINSIDNLAAVFWVFPWDFPATSVNLFFVIVIVKYMLFCF